MMRKESFNNLNKITKEVFKNIEEINTPLFDPKEIKFINENDSSSNNLKIESNNKNNESNNKKIESNNNEKEIKVDKEKKEEKNNLNFIYYLIPFAIYFCISKYFK
jgi:hypothetical protein